MESKLTLNDFSDFLMDYNRTFFNGVFWHICNDLDEWQRVGTIFCSNNPDWLVSALWVLDKEHELKDIEPFVLVWFNRRDAREIMEKQMSIEGV